MNRAILDTNLYIEWIRRAAHEDLVLGRGLARALSAVVVMELRTGVTTRAAHRAVERIVRAHAAARRIVAPSAGLFDEAGGVLRNLRPAGRDIGRASLVHDVLIALTARSIGATVYTLDASDFEAIRAVRRFRLEIVRT